MSRIGKKIIAVPAGVTVAFANGTVTVKGPKGELSQAIASDAIKVAIENNVVTVTRSNEEQQTRAMHGLYRTLINNMIIGVSEGYKKNLLVNGVGYKVAVQGTKLVMNIGFSHPVEVEAPAGITFACPAITEIEISGISKEVVGEIAASIRAIKKPEPYHGYGIQYKDEVVERKEGKAAGKK